MGPQKAALAGQLSKMVDRISDESKRKILENRIYTIKIILSDNPPHLTNNYYENPDISTDLRMFSVPFMVFTRTGLNCSEYINQIEMMLNPYIQ